MYTQPTRSAEINRSEILCSQYGGLTRPVGIMLANGISKFDRAQTYGGSQTGSFLESERVS